MTYHELRKAKDRWVKRSHQDESKNPHQAHNNSCLESAFEAGVQAERDRAVAEAPRPCGCLYCTSGDGYNCIHRRNRRA